MAKRLFGAAKEGIKGGYGREAYLESMASVSSPYPLSLRPSICHFTALSNRKGPRNPNTSFHVLARDITTEALGSVSSGTKHNVLCCKNSEQQHRESRFRVQEGFGAKRRDFVLLMAATATFPLIIPNALAEKDAPENFRVYTDDVNKFKILIPQDWQIGAGETNGFKSITAFYPEEASSTSNVSVVITGLGADFTRMESFGKVDAFAETLVNGLDRSWQRPPGVAAKLIDCKAKNGIYYIEYSLQNPGESRRRLFSAIGMASNGWYNRLYTVTGQFMEEESEKYSFNIEKAVSSFRFI